MEVLLLGLVCWIVTTILVESELTRGVRSYIVGKEQFWRMFDEAWRMYGDREAHAKKMRRVDRRAFLWREARYFIGCHLCTGVWVGLVLSALFGSPWPGFVGWAAGGLLYKAIGHLVLELRPQAWVKS